jgi:hypothetical protein
MNEYGNRNDAQVQKNSQIPLRIFSPATKKWFKDWCNTILYIAVFACIAAGLFVLTREPFMQKHENVIFLCYIVSGLIAVCWGLFVVFEVLHLALDILGELFNFLGYIRHGCKGTYQGTETKKQLQLDEQARQQQLAWQQQQDAIAAAQRHKEEVRQKYLSLSPEQKALYDQGKNDGNDEGYSNGIQQGRQEGFTRGKQAGYNEGYSKGAYNASKGIDKRYY